MIWMAGVSKGRSQNLLDVIPPNLFVVTILEMEGIEILVRPIGHSKRQNALHACHIICFSNYHKKFLITTLIFYFPNVHRLQTVESGEIYHSPRTRRMSLQITKFSQI